jgi:cellulose biosynthesis protein BcsQ
MGTFPADMSGPPESPERSGERTCVLTVSSNKGGVGKTTLATNLAVYVRALREDLPVLILGLDDQRGIDRMFALREPGPGDPNLKHGWAERSLASAIQLGQYGVHFVPSPPDVGLLKARADDPNTLGRILARTAWPGLVILDTKSDLEALTQNAWAAADRILLPVADAASLEEAGKAMRMLERRGLDAGRARVVFTLVDRRARVAGGGSHLFQRLVDQVRREGWPYYKTHLSRSPRVEALNSGEGRPLSVLHHARGTAVHAQLRDLALEVLHDLSLSQRLAALEDGPDELWGRPAAPAPAPVRPPRGAGRPIPLFPRRRR